MQLQDDPDEGRYRAALRRWLSDNARHAPRLDGEPDAGQIEAWRAWSRRLHDAGYAGITWPREHGGQGLGPAHQAIWLQESARAGVPDHLGVIGIGMAGPTIGAWGSEAQKRRFLPPLLRCEEIWCQGFSEPDSGSDLASVRTRAVLDGDAWVVNGQKVWSSYAHIADWCILLVRTDRAASKHGGLSYLLLDMRTPGVTVQPLRQITGDPEFNELFLDGVRVPRDAMLGRPGDGWAVAMTTLSHERGTHGVGLAARLDAELRAAVALLTRRDARGRCPADDPLVRDAIAELSIELHALRITNLRALSALRRDGAPGPAATIAKLRWSELNQRLAALVGDALGPAALERGEAAVDRGRWSFARLRSRGNTIEAGTSEILRTIVAERVLGLPSSR
ncbi:acyl-CoA dehydrogenase family protein [Conexibacter arvalis]|uniref:Alkylation response protein AidB-like acyl-CoA dehydrogenase n=1 Tax=Conexibacter arvalis TaxID=912552 RepID=A0A840I8K4_9ACTN|nr:acyl-CoA dehydrogenase family protein [Conexibacter arvalis]MBB4660438.1 alkylation response protein AidB-like acyl-CoA dehydrogenase [Conexibacter arvalis]